MVKTKATNSALKSQVSVALAACEARKAADVTALELDKVHSGFTDYFVICSGSNPRQIQAISDEVEQRLSSAGLYPAHIEGYQQAEWVLLDYVDFVVHVFSEKARKFYDLERLWKSAKRVIPSELSARQARASRPSSAHSKSQRRLRKK